jgi:hypothetical protein
LKIHIGIKAPDVSWNAPFKAKIREQYEMWNRNGDRTTYTAGGNPRAPEVEVVLTWVQNAWNSLSKEMIAKSFSSCGLTTPIDGSGDGNIHCFKQTGPIGQQGLEALRKFRKEKNAKDGINDHEELFPEGTAMITMDDVDDDLLLDLDDELL